MFFQRHLRCSTTAGIKPNPGFYHTRGLEPIFVGPHRTALNYGLKDLVGAIVAFHVAPFETLRYAHK